MPLKWTNRSRPPSSGVMKPKPLSSLNHLTVPVPIRTESSLEPRPAPMTGADLPTLTGGRHALQGQVSAAGCIGPGVAAAEGARAATGARHRLGGEAQARRPADRGLGEAQVDRALGGARDRGGADLARQPVGAVTQDPPAQAVAGRSRGRAHEPVGRLVAGLALDVELQADRAG